MRESLEWFSFFVPAYQGMEQSAGQGIYDPLSEENRLEERHGKQ